MRSLASGVRQLLHNERHVFADLWRITRADGQQFRFTSHDRVLEFGRQDYTPVGGFSASDMEKEGDLRGITQEFQGVFNATGVTFSDIEARKWRFAKVEYWLTDPRYSAWIDPFRYEVMFVQKMAYTGEGWKADLIGQTRWLRRKVGKKFTRACRHRLGEGFGVPGYAGCLVDVDALSFFSCSVAVLTTQQVFTSLNIPDTLSDDYFQFGEIQWLTGANAGQSVQVKNSWGSLQKLEIILPMPRNIQVGDTFNCLIGCDQTADTCKGKFPQVAGAAANGNFINYGGFLHMPGTDKTMETPK